MPGAERIADHIKFDAVLKKHFMAGKLMAAICAAPAICFEPKGFLEGYAATAHPAFVDELGGSLLEKNIYADCRVVVDKTVVTSRGPGTALEWALCLVEQLYGQEHCKKIARRWWCSRRTRIRGSWSGGSTRRPCPRSERHDDGRREPSISDKVMKHETLTTTANTEKPDSSASCQSVPIASLPQLVGHLSSRSSKTRRAHYSLRDGVKHVTRTERARRKDGQDGPGGRRRRAGA